VTYTQLGTPLEATVEEGLTNEGIATSTGNHLSFRSPRQHVALKADGLGDDQWLTVRAVDDQGRETYAGETQRYGDSSGSWVPSSHYIAKYVGQPVRFLGLNLAPDAKTVTLSVCLHSPRVVEFVFKPPAN